MSRLKPCPFCGSNNIDYSIKTCGSRRKQYHVAMYCKECNCYGKRTLIKLTEEEYRRYDVENNEKYKELAIKAWNTRYMESYVEQLRWERDVAISQLEELGIGFGEKVDDKVVISKLETTTKSKGSD